MVVTSRNTGYAGARSTANIPRFAETMDRAWQIPNSVEALIDSIHNPIIAIDSQGKVVLCNRALEKILGHTRQQLYGQPLASYLTVSQLHRILETGQGELVQRISIGGKVYVSNRTPVRIDRGNHRGRGGLARYFGT